MFNDREGRAFRAYGAEIEGAFLVLASSNAADIESVEVKELHSAPES